MDGAFGPLQPAMCVCVWCLWVSTCVEKRGGGLIALNAERIRPSSRGHDQEERGCVYINDNKTCFKKNEEEKTKNKQ